MKKLKDAAIHWADTQGTHPYSRLCAIDAFTAGGKWMREEMTRWHDPKEELPEVGVCVLIKTINPDGDNAIYMGSWEGDRYITDLGYAFGNSFEDQFDCVGVLDVKAIGWREIHE